MTSIEENTAEGTRLVFEGGLDKVEDLDKVGKLASYSIYKGCNMRFL